MVEAKDQPGGQPQFLYADKRIVDIPGFPDGITGEELSQRTYRQAVDALVQFRFNEELVTIEDTDQRRHRGPLETRRHHSRGAICAARRIIARGLLHYPRRLPVLDQFSRRTCTTRFRKSATTKVAAWRSSAAAIRLWMRR